MFDVPSINGGSGVWRAGLWVFTALIALVTKHDKLKGAEARTKALAMMVPGVILQPNAIFGVTLAQQNGCAFVVPS